MRRKRNEIKSYAMVAGFIAAALLVMAYVSMPISVKATPQVYAYGKITVLYKDGSTEVIDTPKTPFEKASMSLQDFFKSLSVVQRGGKEISSIKAQLFAESSGTTSVVIKGYVNAPDANSEFKQAYILQGGKPEQVWSRTWAENELLQALPYGASDFKVTAEIYLATADGVYRAKVELKAEVAKIDTLHPAQQLTQVLVSDVSANSEVSGGPVTTTTTAQNAYNGMYVPNVVGMTAQEYVKTVEQITGKPYTDQVTVQTRPGSYVPEPGSLAAQDQYCYDVTDLYITMRDTGQLPPNWITYVDQFGQTTYKNTITGSEVHVGKSG
ncbi:MAG: hypothetical protein QXR95_06890 [Nitrososphaerota archaeon]